MSNEKTTLHVAMEMICSIILKPIVKIFAATTRYWIYGVDGTHWKDAAMVLGKLSAFGKCESGIFEEFTASAQSVDISKYQRIHQSAFLTIGHSSARLAIHHRHHAIHSGRLQFPVMAGNGSKYKRSFIVFTISNSSINTII